MKNKIIFGIGILISLLALAGTGSARFAYASDCGHCHDDYPRPLTANGVFFNDTHKFDGIARPISGASCTECHIDPGNAVTGNFTLTGAGTSYNVTHRYNRTTLGSKFLSSPGCGNCHVDALGKDFSMKSGNRTYLTSSVCQDCHKAKYDNWTNTMHRVMLTPKDTAEAMGLPTPWVGWANISYVIVSKPALEYINSTGYFLTENGSYETELKEFENGTHAGGTYGTCGRCHTTGWNTSGWNASLLNGILPGINGTFSEPGIACERCHMAGGNGHQVVVNYSGDLCRECHTGGTHGTGWENGLHAPPPFEIGSSCMFCHSSFDQYKNQNVTEENATGVTCGVCHDTHDMTDDQYGPLYSPNGYNTTIASEIKVAKLSFFNATASIASGTDIFDILISPALLYNGTDSSRKDSSYGTAPINVTGAVSNVLCSKCHYRHGLGHIAGVNLSHGTASNPNNAASCIDCHMEKAGSDERTVMKKHALDPLAYVNNSCGGNTKCHETSSQNLSNSLESIVPVQSEWEGTAHNDKETGLNHSNLNSSFYRSINATTGIVSIKSRANSCLKCHSPFDWNPATAESNTTNTQLSEDFKGIVCAVCHNIHDMGNSITESSGKKYSWYNRDGVYTGRYKANYTLMADTTELCGNCHSNIRYGNTGPGWASDTATTPISQHGFPAKDVFVGSWKQSSILGFECIDCHMYTNKTNASGGVLNDTEKIMGHSFAVNATGLQNTSGCNTCHVEGSILGSIPSVIGEIQTSTQNKWNTTNITVMNALANIKLSTGQKNLSRYQIAQAYWNLKLVQNDESWGVHNPSGTDQLLDDAATLAIAANASLGRGNTTVQLYAGWNLVSLNETPASTAPLSVMSSVSSNLTRVIGYNSTGKVYMIYDPATVNQSLNTLTRMVKTEGYWINVESDCVWVV